MFKNICYVTLKGGLGNQLLQYNFANDLIQSGKNVKIDTRFYQNKSYNSLDTPRLNYLIQVSLGLILQQALKIYIKII